MPNDKEIQLASAAVAAGIMSREELSNFMAQVGHESNGLNRLDEGFNYTNGIGQIPVRSARRHGDEALESARIEALRGDPEPLAELMYGGRMGNDQPGDGYRYHGRGYIQLTGKDNYRDAGNALGLDLMTHPELAADPEHAAKIAVRFWQANVPAAARRNVTAATHAINGGENGLSDRQQRYAEWYGALTPEFVEQLSEGRTTPQTAVDQGRSPRRGDPMHEPQGGADVRHLQQVLNKLGYHDAHGHALNVDGDFGDRTRGAVMAFQQAHGLQPVGHVGPKTRAALREAELGATPVDLAHPDHALYRQALAGVQRLDTVLGRQSDEASERMAASLARLAKESGLTRVDHVVLSIDNGLTRNGENVFVVQGRLDDPAHARAHMRTQLAVDTPVAESFRQLEAVNQKQQSEQQQATQISMGGRPHGEYRDGPRMMIAP